jgi:non-lysosomal glucosylceramidase
MSSKYTKEQLFSLGSQKRYHDEYLNEISFPLGGIGTGSIGLSGRGSLRDFEIFNRPNMGSWYQRTFACIRTQMKEQDKNQASKRTYEDTVCRVLEAPLPRPYTPLDGGLFHANGEGLPHMDSVIFTGEYPFALLDFQCDKMPVSVQLEAYNPFIPSEPDASSIPCAILHYHVRNKTAASVHVSIMWSMLNMIGTSPDNLKTGFDPSSKGTFHNLIVQEESLQGIVFSNLDFKATDPKYGSMALLTPNKNVSFTSYWKQVPWFTPHGDIWNYFKQHGCMVERNTKTINQGSPDAGVVCIEEDLDPNKEKTFTFYITWYFPNFEKYWGGGRELGKVWPNFYTKMFDDAVDVGVKLHQHEVQYRADSKLFHDALFQSTYPPYVLDAVSSNMAILKTATCVRLTDGTFYGWEGTQKSQGCCEGTCAHVWNYQQALPFLFPQLERSIHEADFKYNFLFQDLGALEFRTQLPLGSGHGFTQPAADGQWGRIINMYREWKISGKDDWLRSHWASVKKAIDFAFEDWDEARKGVLTSYQHNTYDIEFYGPTMMLTCYYLAALKAGAEMAKFANDHEAAEEYMKIFTEGEKYCDSKLFNGEYYIQLPPPFDKAPINQVGTGCLIDQLVGLEIARIAGVSNYLNNAHVKSALRSIFKYNYKSNMREHENYQRLYAVNDEAATVICTWPKGGRPEVPFPYADEVMNGFEYQFAVHCILEDLLEEGLTVVKSIRDRFDGYGRNPWDEFECGHHYARSMASYGLIIALSGFQYDKGNGFIGFSPKLHTTNFKTFWSLDSVWGTFQLTSNHAELAVLYGEFNMSSIRLTSSVKNKKIKVVIWSETFTITSDETGLVKLPKSLKLLRDSVLKFDF